MSKLSWGDIFGATHDFIYNHTELAIWLGLSLLLIIVFALLVYSIAFRRFLAIVLLFAGLAVYGLHYFGYWDRAHAPVESVR